MKLLYQRYHNWELSNISAVVEVFENEGNILVYVNGKDKTHVKEEIFKTINWKPQIISK